MKRLMIVALAVLCAAALVPQNLAAGVGIKGGYSLAKFSWNSTDVPTMQNLPASVAGVFFKLGLGPLAIQPEVLYIRMGAKYEDLGGKVETRVDYVQVPVLLKLSVIPLGPIRPVIYAGGYGAMRIKARMVMIVDGQVIDDADVSDEYGKYDYGLVGGAGLDIKLPGIAISIEGRYNYGLINVDTTAVGADYKKNRTLMGLIGIGF